jgi:hypothetical protein
MRRRRVVSRAAVAATVAGLVALAPAGAGADAVVGVSANTVEPGQTLLVSSRGWAPGTILTMELCGRQGAGGSADCAVAQQRMATADDRGSINETMEVAVPPAPCPCVVKVSSMTRDAFAVAPVTVVGAPFDDTPLPSESVTPRLEIVDAHLEGTGPWTAWFGASPQRDLVVTLRNPGVSAVEGAGLYITAGKADHPTRVVSSAPLTPVLPRATKTVRVPVALGALWYGKATVRVAIAGLADGPEVAATTSSHPWGLAVLVVITLQLLLLAVRNRVRRRLARRESVVVGAPIAERPVAEKPVALEPVAFVERTLADEVVAVEDATAPAQAIDVIDVRDAHDTAPTPGARPAVDVRSAMEAIDAAAEALAAVRRALAETLDGPAVDVDDVGRGHRPTVVDLASFGRRAND